VTSRADKFLEGFKLGSLGVSRKPKVSPLEIAPEPVTIEVTKRGTNTSVDGMDLPYLYWKEKDGMSYCLRMTDTEGALSYKLRFYGGEKLIAIKSTSRKVVYPNGSKWTADSTEAGYDTIYDLLQKFISIVKKEGIDGLFTGGHISTFNSTDFSRASYDQWLKGKGGKK
jgi:hypothetical protein